MKTSEIKLTYTSKMPGASFSLSAFKCITGSKLNLQEGTVCSKCYARKGRYLFSNVKNAQTKRFELIEDKDFVKCMTEVLKNDKITQKIKLFRWHDSGDIQSLNHLKKIVQIAENLPDIKFWMPTKEYSIIKKYNGEIPKNLIIRVSYPMINGKFTNNEYPYTSNVYSKDKLNEVNKKEICPATENHNSCDENKCMKFWDKSIKNIVYIKH